MLSLNRQLLKIIVLAVIYITISTSPVYAIPYVSSNYYCLMDGPSGQVILSKNSNEMRPVASTTKMMTAILAIEYAELTETAVVSSNADNTPEFTIGLRAGQEISVSELLKVSLVRSSNDAAVVLAEYVAGDESLFSYLMSKKAFLIGATNTHFKNASGLPASGHYSTAYDLCQIGRYLLTNNYLGKLVATKQIEFKHPGYQKPLTIKNTNGLLNDYKGADGIKTGTTNAAGKCLVASATRNGQQFIAVTLKSADRKGDCARLLDYGFNDSFLNKIVDSSIPFKEIKLKNGKLPYVKIFPKEDLLLWQSTKSPDIEKKVNFNYVLEAPVIKGQKVGFIEIYADGKLVKSIDLICGQTIDREPCLLKRLIKNFCLKKD